MIPTPPAVRSIVRRRLRRDCFDGTILPAIAFALVLSLFTAHPAQAQWTLRVETQKQWLRGTANDATLSLRDEKGAPVRATAVLTPVGRWTRADGSALASMEVAFDSTGTFAVEGLLVEGDAGFTLVAAGHPPIESSFHVVHPGWVLLPPLLSIVLALWLRQVLLALTAGILAGAWIFTGDPFSAFVAALQVIVVGAVSDPFQAAILLFTAVLGGMVGVMARAGGTHGLVEAARHWIRDARSAQFSTAVMGLVIFFDDYANTLLVGNTMRPVTDRMRVSREKLSYLVDSTAAPVATIALLSTWVGYQVGLIADGLSAIGRGTESAYAVFVSSVPYASYSWFALALVFWVVATRRDFGPMRVAELRTRSTGEVLGPQARPLADDIGTDLQPTDGAPRRAHLALVPVVVVLVTTVLGLWWDGRRTVLASSGSAGLAETGLRDVFASADPAAALLWAVVIGATVAIALAVSERIVPLSSAMDAFVSGAKAMVPALIILVLAWSIGDVCEKLRTADVVVDVATGSLSARLVPTVTFLVAAFLGFSTGTSWGTMAILMPIVVPLSTELPAAAGLGVGASSAIFLASVASVLSGSVFGDHCSPISDTTIMSSMASGADHVDHVRTQLPYALSAGTVAVVMGTLPAGYGVAPWITLPLGVLLLGVIVRAWGRTTEIDPVTTT